jgi:uncharacterized protein YdiU (UPF0061 family)
MNWKLEQSYLTLPEYFHQIVSPTRVANPKIVIFNAVLAKQLGLVSKDALTSEEIKNFTSIFSGNEIPAHAVPFAQAYAGHQFAHFTMLGDGRAILLGEHISPHGQRYDVQWKGAGPTRFSRRGDGRAALGPMLREYIISEAMQAMGIPTTRSLAVVATGEKVHRETELPGAILTRVAQSHLRVGTFQFASAVNRDGQYRDLKTLVQYTLDRNFSEIATQDFPIQKFLNEVIERQAKLISQWMLVGFIHGVMNTDNMSICGETLDYGPCAFMDTYHSQAVFSSIDHHGRYAYGNQPRIAQWNLARFAESLLPLLDDDQTVSVKIAEEAVGSFTTHYQRHWLEGMRKKLGLMTEENDDARLAQELLTLMEHHELDYTNTFRDLTRCLSGDVECNHRLSALHEWKWEWQSRLARQKHSVEDAVKIMNQANPVVIPRNHRLEEALNAATLHDDFSKVHRLIEVLQKPFEDSDDSKPFQLPPAPNEVVTQTFCGT